MRGIEKGATSSKDKAGDALIFVAGQPPIKAQQVLFYQDDVLRSRTELPAAALGSDTPVETQ